MPEMLIDTPSDRATAGRSGIGPRVASPCVLVLFGAAGDLIRRLLVPALYNLTKSGLLPDQFTVLGFDHNERKLEDYRAALAETTRKFVATRKHSSGKTVEWDQTAWDWLADRIFYQKGDFDDAASYQGLGQRLEELNRERGTAGNYLFYLAAAPRFFGPVVRHLGQSGLAREEGRQWRRVIIEKPFGHDLASARDLNREILQFLQESQVYRIDHFLGKETVQNIMVFRFANGFFEPMWNRDHIDHVQITVAETVGVEQRGNFYDQTGALRDMVPNHLLQLFALTAMAPPNSFAADAVRTEKAKVLDAVHRFSEEDALRNAVRGQYAAGVVGGQVYRGYREETNVRPDSNMETYVALKLMIDNWRWAGVPFYLRTGKALRRRTSEIAIQFKQAPFALFRDTPVDKLTPNFLLLHIQPEEGVSMQFGAKIPGQSLRLGSVEMSFRYEDYFDSPPATGYETLVYDCMMGDPTLFQRADNIEDGWSVVQPVLDAWAAHRPAEFPNYMAGSEGPSEADRLIERDGRRWRKL